MRSRNTSLVAHIECPGGGQVWVDGDFLYVGHMRYPSGTSVIDVKDPRNPRIVSRIEMPVGWHSHKVRAANGLMLVNHEKMSAETADDMKGGLAVYDVSRPDSPRLLSKWSTGGIGTHRFDFDGRYAYISSTADGYIGNMPIILDLADPEHPVETSRWWIPGQWKAGGEPYPWEGGPAPRCHHPIRVGDRLYVSYWHHGFVILDISDIAAPKFVSGFNTGPVFPSPTHTCLPIPGRHRGRKVMIVADEDAAKLRRAAPSFTWVFDITDETQPIPISTFQVAGLDPDGASQDQMMGCHQPSERFNGTIVPFAWFAQGLRIIDFKDPFSPLEIGHYLPAPAPGQPIASSNDVTIDDRGLIYLIDRVNGVDIIEAT